MESIECYSDEELYEGIQEIVSSSVVGACLRLRISLKLFCLAARAEQGRRLFTTSFAMR